MSANSQPNTVKFNVSKLLILVACIFAVLSAFGVQFGPASFAPLALAFLCAGFLVP